MSVGENRTYATLVKYALNSAEHSDFLVGIGRAWLDRTLKKLPPETGRFFDQEIDLQDATMEQIAALEECML